MNKFCFLSLLVLIVAGNLTATEPSASGYVEKLFFITKGDSTLKVSYNGETWEVYNGNANEENWSWYTPEEYEEIIGLFKDKEKEILQFTLSIIVPSVSFKAPLGEENRYYRASLFAERDQAKLSQTLTDIKNGIKVSRPKTIYIKDGIDPMGAFFGWVTWCCYSYSFQDSAGKEINLGPFETRDELFAALKQHYNSEVSSGRLTQTEADSFYAKLAHPVRNVDEAPLVKKLLNPKLYNSFNSF